MNAMNALRIEEPHDDDEPFVRPRGYPADLDHALDLSAPDLVARLELATRKYPGHTCLEYFGTRLSYADVWQRACRFSDALRLMGMGQGDRVMIVMPNAPEAVIALLATLIGGGIIVMSNPLLSRDEHAFQVSDSEPKVAIVLDMLAPRFSELMQGQQDHALAHVVSCHLGDAMPWHKRTVGRWLNKIPRQPVSRLKGVITFGDALRVGQGHGVQPVAAHEDDAAVLIYTGGTTGKPKAVELSRGHVSANISQIAAWLNFLEDGNTNVLGVFPLFSAAGLNALLLHTFVRGGTLSLIPRPTPEAIVDVLKRLPIHVLPAVPTIYTGLMRDGRFMRSAPRLMRHVKVCLSGAAPLPESLNRQWAQMLGMPIHELYGMTETSAMAFGNRPGSPIKSGSAGLPLPRLQCQIMDLKHEGRPLGTGQVGEICLKGPQILSRYFKQPEETSKAIKGGWLHTGDLGWLDEDGYLFISGRKKEMVISSGYNVYPAEIESVLSTLPGVLECACIGVKDDYRGEAVKAFIVADPNKPLSAEEAIAHCGRHLARYKVPREVVLVSELPKNPLGKVLKQMLS